MTNPSEPNRGENLAKSLGWFSIGLGIAEVVAPDRIAALIGVRDQDNVRTVLRGFGLREIATGVGILSQPANPSWMWGRVAGDLLDMATLASAMNTENADRTRLTAATAAVAGVAALDVYCGTQLSAEDPTADSGAIDIVKTIAVNRPPEEVYRFWRDFQNLPRFMSHLEAVDILDDRRSHWRTKGPAGMTIEWDAEIEDDQPHELIAWHSLEGSDVDHRGLVRFEPAPGGRGTILRVELNYRPPGGAAGALFARLFGSDPEQQMDRDLRQFKQVMEVGEVVHSDASIHTGMHPAQPPADSAHSLIAK
jgi:uncharacterized membrane protein